MTTNDQSPEIIEATIEEEELTVEGDFSALLSGDVISETKPASKLEVALSGVNKEEEKAAKKPGDAKLQFRSFLADKQLAELKAGAPEAAERFIGDVNHIMSFGGKTMEKLRSTSKQMLDAQRSVRLPDAEALTNNLLRELDGFQKKRQGNKGVEKLGKKIFGFFRNAKYSAEVAVREMKPLEDKLDMAEIKLEEMDIQLADNVARGQLLHAQTLKQMGDVVTVLASLEEIIENIRAEYEEADALFLEAERTGEEQIEYKGKVISKGELQEERAKISLALNESEKSWFDWRQQFFLGWANAPAMRNLVVSTFGLRRRLRVFKDMGIQSGRQALVSWKQAQEAREGAEMGAAVRDATNEMVKSAYGEMADTTELVSKVANDALLEEETIASVIDSVKRQAHAMVEADRQGRELRHRNLQALERGEVEIQDVVLDMEAKLVNNARNDPGLGQGQSNSSQKSIGGGSGDLLGNL